MIAVAFGTRPDQIKMAPVVAALKDAGADVEVWYSGQGWDLRPAEYQYVISHTERIGWPTQAAGVSATVRAFDDWLNTRDEYPECVVVHGDDATAYACGLASFLNEVPVAHVEAGLRTYQREPYPEEAYRRMIAAFARWHFCPDQIAYMNLVREFCNEPEYMKVCDDNVERAKYCQVTGNNAFVVGNTVNDTLPDTALKVFATLHRRENWGDRITQAIRVLGDFGAAASVTVVKHPNWANHLDSSTLHPAVTYVDPLDRSDFLQRLQGEADVVVTDSGGVQEECAWFGVPCIVVRSATERVALLRSGAVELVDPDKPEELRRALQRHLDRRYAYGRGDTGKQIAEILMRELQRD